MIDISAWMAQFLNALQTVFSERIWFVGLQGSYARGEATDRIVGLELGADDYVVKPFEPRELVARIRSVLRRANREVLRAHMEGCLQQAVRSGDEADASRKIEEVIAVLEKLQK